MKVAVAIVALLSLSACGTASPQATNDPKHESGDHGLNVIPTCEEQTNTMNSERISGNKLRDLLLGNKFKLGPPGAPEIERFSADGSWTGIRGGITVLMQHGDWFVRGDLLCVKSDEDPIDCRPVWKSNRDNHYLIYRPASWGSMCDVVEAMVEPI